MKKIITLLFITFLLASCGTNNEYDNKENKTMNENNIVKEKNMNQEVESEPLSEAEIDAAINELFSDIEK